MAKLLTFKELDSTSNYIKNHVHELKHMSFVRAYHQAAGRGQGDHTWESDNNNLLFSFLMKDVTFDNVTYLPIVIGAAVFKVLQTYHISNIKIKWPNDIMVNDNKIAGILLESRLPEYLIAGIGINVNQKEFANLIATSLSNELHREINISPLYRKLRRYIIKEIKTFIKGKSNYMKVFEENKYQVPNGK